MDLDIKIEKDTVRLKVIGAIDTEGGSEMTTKFMEITRIETLKHALVDLSEVPSITSAGIGKLLAFFKTFDSRKGSMKITGISDQLRKQFAEIHLDRIIPIS